MSSIIYRPNADLYVGPVSPTPCYSLLNDQSDATYIQRSSGSGFCLAVGLPANSIPAGSTINWVKLGGRVSNGTLMAEMSFYGGAVYTVDGSATQQTSFADVVTTFTTDPRTGVAWLLTDSNMSHPHPLDIGTLDSINVYLICSLGGPVLLSELWVEVDYTGGGGGSHTLTYEMNNTYGQGTDGCYISGDTVQSVADGTDGTEVMATFTQTTPGVHYRFVVWSDDSLPPTIPAARTDTNVTGDITVDPHYGLYFIQTYAVNNVIYGSLTGNVTQNVWKSVTYPYFADKSDIGDLDDIKVYGTEVTAVPNSGYHFVQWSDDVMTASRTDTDPTADASVTAIFAPDALPFVPQIWEY